MPDTLPILYNIAIEAAGEQALVQWGEEANWIESYRPLLASALRLTLIPKDANSGLPVVTVALSANQRWIVFSRVYGNTNGGSTRLYAIGHQSTIGDTNTKSLIWVYPSGALELANEPSYWRAFLE